MVTMTNNAISDKSPSDIKTLKKNLPKILKSILECNNFLPIEINRISDNYIKEKEKYNNMRDYLRRPESSGRERLLSDIYKATEIENLIKVDDFLNLKNKNPDEELIRILNILGIVDDSNVSIVREQ